MPNARLPRPRTPSPDPTVLYRFLIAGGRDPEKAAALVHAMLSWRDATGVDALVRNFDFAERGAYLAAYPQGYHKTDRAGRPVFIQQLGRADVDAVLAVTTEQRMIHFHLQEYEKLLAVVLPACNAAAGGAARADAAAGAPRVRGSTSVIDLQGVGFGSLLKSKRLLTLFMSLDAAYFPGGGGGGGASLGGAQAASGVGGLPGGDDAVVGASTSAVRRGLDALTPPALRPPAQPRPPPKHALPLAAETMDCLLVIGAPSWFSSAVSAFRSLLSPELQSRMEVIPGDFRPRLRELIGEENLLVGGLPCGEAGAAEAGTRRPA
jgi:hypothetical protein